MPSGNLASLARLDMLTLTIGEDTFGSALLNTVRSIGAVDHVTIFSFAPRCAPRMVVSTGSIEAEAADRAGARYQSDLYLLDPNYQQVRQQTEGTSVIWFDFDRDGGYCDAFREGFLDSTSVSDILSFSICQDKVIYYVMLLRTQGRAFAAAERWLLHQIGEVLAANVRKHFSYMHMIKGKNQFMIGRILSESSVFRDVTGRERAVCIGILTGHTSESISLNLSISINSVLTYRKRLYEKLGITSQNELFAQVIGAMIKFGGVDLDDGETMLVPQLKDHARPASPAKRERLTKRQDSYLAEAFLA